MASVELEPDAVGPLEAATRVELGPEGFAGIDDGVQGGSAGFVYVL